MMTILSVYNKQSKKETQGGIVWLYWLIAEINSNLESSNISHRKNIQSSLSGSEY